MTQKDIQAPPDKDKCELPDNDKWQSLGELARKLAEGAKK